MHAIVPERAGTQMRHRAALRRQVRPRGIDRCHRRRRRGRRRRRMRLRKSLCRVKDDGGGGGGGGFAGDVREWFADDDGGDAESGEDESVGADGEVLGELVVKVESVGDDDVEDGEASLCGGLVCVWRERGREVGDSQCREW